MNINALKLIDNSVNWLELDGDVLVFKIVENVVIANYLDTNDWDKLKGWNWSRLLSTQSQFSGFCDWDKLNGANWSWLLREQPQFSEYCDWNKLKGLDWSWLLRAQPQLSVFRK